MSETVKQQYCRTHFDNPDMEFNVFLHSGVRLQGFITSYDKEALILDDMLVMFDVISTIKPLGGNHS